MTGNHLEISPIAGFARLTALTLVSEHGVAGASLRKLAAELGISQPSLYHYFPSADVLSHAEWIVGTAERLLGQR